VPMIAITTKSSTSVKPAAPVIRRHAMFYPPSRLVCETA
jgi:hypothetical protein